MAIERCLVVKGFARDEMKGKDVVGHLETKASEGVPLSGPFHFFTWDKGLLQDRLRGVGEENVRQLDTVKLDHEVITRVVEPAVEFGALFNKTGLVLMLETFRGK